MSDPSSRTERPSSASHVERLKGQHLSTFTSGIGVTVQRVPDSLMLPLPGVTQFLHYRWAYWTSTMRNLRATHGLRTDTVGVYGAPVTITPVLRARWQRLFNDTGDRSDPDVPVPYLYNQSVGTLLYTRLLADLGINFRHLLHVQHETMHWASVLDWVNTDRQELHASVRGAWRLGDGKAMIALRNAMIRQLAVHGRPLVRFSMSFASPAFLDQTLRGHAGGRVRAGGREWAGGGVLVRGTRRHERGVGQHHAHTFRR